MLTLQRLCAMFLVHYGVNLWTLNNELMSAYDMAAASNHVSLARFLDTAASQAFVDDWHGVMKLCRRAAKSARRRLKVQRHSVDYKTSPPIDDWRTKTLPDGASSSSVTSGSRPPRSLVFVQSPRLANGKLFPAATDSDALSHSKSTGRRKQRRFWPISTRHVKRHATECDRRPSRVAAAARQLLLMSVDDTLLHEAQSRVAREQLRLSSLRLTNDDNLPLTPFCAGVDSQFYCQSRTSNDTTAAVVNDSHKLSQNAINHNPARRQQRQSADANETATDKTSTCAASDVYTVVAVDCSRPRPVTGAHRPSSQSTVATGLAQTSLSVRSEEDLLRRWLVNNGLVEYWPLLEMEKVDMNTVTLLRDEDLRQLGIPLGPRRRLQRAIGQLDQSPALTTAVSNTTFL